METKVNKQPLSTPTNPLSTHFQPPTNPLKELQRMVFQTPNYVMIIFPIKHCVCLLPARNMTRVKPIPGTPDF